MAKREELTEGKKSFTIRESQGEYKERSLVSNNDNNIDGTSQFFRHY